MPDEHKTSYDLGKRAAYNTILAYALVEGEKDALRQVARELLKFDPENPHAKQWIESHKQ